MARDLGAEAAQAIPITVLTGFLGSGKTTLLNTLLAHPDMGETAVLINEFGEIAIDHLLVQEISEDVVMLNSGCLCCTVRGDLVDSLKDLFLKRVRGEVPEFQRVVIETTGLADPAPIVHTLTTDPLIASRYRLDGVVTTVDGVNGEQTLDAQPESVKQAAIADRLLVTKADIADPTAFSNLKTRLSSLNPAANLIEAVNGAVSPEHLLNCGLFQPHKKIPDVAGWLRDEAFKDQEAHHHHHHHDVNRHDDRIEAFCLTFDTPIRWERLSEALELLIAMRGEQLLRLKGIANIETQEGPVALHAVQHVFHPPVPLPEWPDDDHRTKLVFITRDLGRKAVEDLLAAFL